MNNFFGKQIMETLQEISEDLWNTFFGFFEAFYTDIGWITDHEYVNTACGVTAGIATAFLVLLASKHLFTTYILETDGDAEMDPLQFLVKASLSLAFIQMQNFMFYYLLKLSEMLCDQITGFLAPVSKEVDIFGGFLSALGLGAISALAFTIAFIVISVILIFKAALRAVELAIMKIMFPLFCCDMMTPNRERWNTFFMAYLVTIFSYIIQIFCFRMCAALFMSSDRIEIVIGALCMGYFAVKAPKWLEKFTYSSGMGRTAGGLGRAAYTVLQVVRFVK